MCSRCCSKHQWSPFVGLGQSRVATLRHAFADLPSVTWMVASILPTVGVPTCTQVARVSEGRFRKLLMKSWCSSPRSLQQVLLMLDQRAEDVLGEVLRTESSMRVRRMRHAGTADTICERVCGRPPEFHSSQLRHCIRCTA